tara:strand:- start:336 stop:497 length:162 start_codon:yes stop_codon:yes gene_type:complete
MSTRRRKPSRASSRRRVKVEEGKAMRTPLASKNISEIVKDIKKLKKKKKRRKK